MVAIGQMDTPTRETKEFNMFFLVLCYFYAHSGLLKWTFPWADLSFILLGAVLLVGVFQLKKILIVNPLLNKAFVWLVIFHVIVIGSLVYTASASYALEKTVKIMANLVLLLMIMSVFIDDGKRLIENTKKVNLVVTIIAIGLLFWGLSVNQLFDIRFRDPDVSRYPGYISVAFFLGTSALVNFNLNFRFLVLSLLIFFLMLFLASKSAIFFLLLPLLYLMFKTDLKISKTKLVFGLLLFLVVSGLLFKDAFEVFLGRLIFFDEDVVDYSTLLRLIAFEKAFLGFVESPVVGWGIGSYGTYAIGDDVRLSSHNIFLEVAMELGLVGLIVFTVFLYYLFKLLRFLARHVNEKLNVRIVAAVLFYFLLMLNVICFLEDLRILYFWLAIFMISLNNNVLTEQSSQSNVRD